jgi:hypothetical protein
MPLSCNQDIPPIFDGILQKINDKEKVTVSEFHEMLHGLRITNDDIENIERWLINKGIITRVIGGEEKKGRQDYIVLCFIKQINK